MMCSPTFVERENRSPSSSSSLVVTRRARRAGWCLALLVNAIHQTSSGWVDTDTPLNKRTTTSFIDGTEYHLVMSDEFNVPNRSFADGHDPVWTALDKSDDDSSSAGGGSMQFYNSSTVYTRDGYLNIDTIMQKTAWSRYDHVNKKWKTEQTNFSSGMVQSWNKFCFTGGIVEVDVIFPGDPFIGGLWPAVWMLGNLGRATYEASTNNIWPWSYNTCDRDLQEAQAISACNSANHFGLFPFQGRGATEIDIVEVMTGDSNGYLPSTKPGVSLPYADLTLQVAPGVPKNRPQSGSLPVRKRTVSSSGHTEFAAQIWYEGLLMEGNTSINPFFYGTYLAETRPDEPVLRNKNQAFQADAVGAAHQLTEDHFTRPHTFRLEWQPGPGGRIDWFVRGYQVNETFAMTGDGKGQDWIHAYGILDHSLSSLMGSQIPVEPSYLIMNTAVSSTWGFPYDTPDWCTKCYDCDDPKCACTFYPGFCEMIRSGKVSLKIDSIRVYQSRNSSSHIGAPHSLGCDPVEYPTKEWIDGHQYRYMRNPPFVYDDTTPLRRVQKGGGSCLTDKDCGGDVKNTNWTAVYEQFVQTGRRMKDLPETAGRGQCVARLRSGILSALSRTGSVCSCNVGFTGPHCLSLAHTDDTPSAHAQRIGGSPFDRISSVALPGFLLVAVTAMVALLFVFLVGRVLLDKRTKEVKTRSSNGANPLNISQDSYSRISVPMVYVTVQTKPGNIRKQCALRFINRRARNDLNFSRTKDSHSFSQVTMEYDDADFDDLRQSNLKKAPELESELESKEAGGCVKNHPTAVDSASSTGGSTGSKSSKPPARDNHDVSPNDERKTRKRRNDVLYSRNRRKRERSEADSLREHSAMLSRTNESLKKEETRLLHLYVDATKKIDELNSNVEGHNIGIPSPETKMAAAAPLSDVESTAFASDVQSSTDQRTLQDDCRQTAATDPLTALASFLPQILQNTSDFSISTPSLSLILSQLSGSIQPRIVQEQLRRNSLPHASAIPYLRTDAATRLISELNQVSNNLSEINTNFGDRSSATPSGPLNFLQTISSRLNAPVPGADIPLPPTTLSTNVMAQNTSVEAALLESLVCNILSGRPTSAAAAEDNTGPSSGIHSLTSAVSAGVAPAPFQARASNQPAHGGSTEGSSLLILLETLLAARNSANAS